MKQTVTILTAMMVAMLLVSGFMVMGSMEQTEKLIEREDRLLKQGQELDEKTLMVEKLEKAAQERDEQMAQILQERDALSIQLNDAVLSSQESNDVLSQQIQELRRLQMEKEQLSKQLLQERKDVQALRTQLAALQESPAPTPTPFRVERRVK